MTADPALTALLKGVNLYLVGPMGCGKTTVGPLLAAALGYRFLDTDRFIEQATSQTVAQIFADSGEAVFRQLETATLANLAPQTRHVIATGGGIVLARENWGHLRQGVVIWLDAPIGLLTSRLAADTSRPLLQGVDLTEKLTRLDQERRALYGQADLHVPIGPTDSPEAIADRALADLLAACRHKAALDQDTDRLNALKPFTTDP
jgi:shikimate kinase